MLKSERIKDAETNIPLYLIDGLLKKKSTETIIINRFVENARESFAVADHLLNERRSALWTIVTSYYSMFYIANAYLCKMSLRVGEQIAHKVTADALIVYTRKKVHEHISNFEEAQEDALELSRADDLIHSFDQERDKRSRFQYKMTETVLWNKAETSLKRAREFLSAFEQMTLEQS